VVSLLILPASIKSDKGTKPINLSPFFVTGFSPAESSFSVAISKNYKLKIPGAATFLLYLIKNKYIYIFMIKAAGAAVLVIIYCWVI
jgi:hypothetical protein